MDQVQSQPDPVQEPESEETEAQDTDTQEATTAPPTEDAGGHGEEEASASAPSEEGQPDDREELARRREEGKLQQVQQELEEYRERAQRLDNIEKAAMQSPEKYKRALVDFNGWDEATAENYVQDLRRRGVWSETPQPEDQYGPRPQPTVDPYVAAQQVIQQQKVAETIQRQFFERVPELNPETLPLEKHSMARSLTTAIEFEARERLQANPKADFVETLVEVYKDFTGKTDEQLATAREEGKMEGYLEATASSAGTSRSSKGTTPKESDYGLTPEELDMAKAEGLSAKEFAELKNPITQVK